MAAFGFIAFVFFVALIALAMFKDKHYPPEDSDFNSDFKSRFVNENVNHIDENELHIEGNKIDFSDSDNDLFRTSVITPISTASLLDDPIDIRIMTSDDNTIGNSLMGDASIGSTDW